VGPQNLAHFLQKLVVRDAIQRAQDALTQNDNQKALEQLSTADIELLKVSQKVAK
jgi:hypothetical protein